LCAPVPVMAPPQTLGIGQSPSPAFALRIPTANVGSQPSSYSDVRLLPCLQHSLWLLSNVAACQAMANLLTEKHDVFWREFKVVVAAGASAGIGLEALPPVRKAIGGGFETIINKSEKVKDLKNQAKNKDLTEKQKKQLTDEEKEYKS